MNITIEMSMVAECSHEECAYNTGKSCHAKAITVGDSINPLCDTVLHRADNVHATDIHAGVGACKVSDCSFNEDLECTADSIAIGLQNDNARCMTYETH